MEICEGKLFFIFDLRFAIYAGRKFSCIRWHADSCPEGTFENNPRFQPWVVRQLNAKSRRDVRDLSENWCGSPGFGRPSGT